MTIRFKQETSRLCFCSLAFALFVTMALAGPELRGVDHDTDNEVVALSRTNSRALKDDKEEEVIMRGGTDKCYLVGSNAVVGHCAWASIWKQTVTSPEHRIKCEIFTESVGTLRLMVNRVQKRPYFSYFPSVEDAFMIVEPYDNSSGATWDLHGSEAFDGLSCIVRYDPQTQ
eukprot:GFYU01000893.1.p1 GENE.GFYU01000893.1~~GFYU01000893.1.p1  ORF type:complete len:195 (+),score=16.43 GFYU01000893.1:72-587(+)